MFIIRYFIMPQRIPFEENCYYHIFNRWLNHKTLFFSDRDFQQFLRYLNINLEKYKLEIWLIAYCILPNHFHLVLLNKREWDYISKFIWNICVSYVRWYKTKYQINSKWESFFEGRFKSKKLMSEEYLATCVNYVEFNAIKHKIVDKPNQRIFTSWNWKTNISDQILNLDWEF